MFTDVLTFSCSQVGKNFQNIPFSLYKRSFGYDRYTADLLGTDGGIVETVSPSRYYDLDHPAEALAEKEAFKFSSNPATVVVAMILTNERCRGSVEKCIMLLSEPMTIAKMQQKRDSAVFEKKKSLEDKRLGEIQMLWGKAS